MPSYHGSGCAGFDVLLGGGMEPEAPYILNYEPGAGHMVFIANYLNEGLRAGELAVVVTSDLTYSRLLGELRSLNVDVQEAL